MKTELEFETHELTVIRVHRRRTIMIFCPRCEKKVAHLSVARASAALNISETAVFRLVESDAVHWLETASGALLVCGNSIPALTKENRIIEEGNNVD